MPVLYEIHWLPDRRVEKFAGSRGNYYEIPNSEPLDIDTIPVWCHQCEKLLTANVSLRSRTSTSNSAT